MALFVLARPQAVGFCYKPAGSILISEYGLAKPPILLLVQQYLDIAVDIVVGYVVELYLHVLLKGLSLT